MLQSGSVWTLLEFACQTDDLHGTCFQEMLASSILQIYSAGCTRRDFYPLKTMRRSVCDRFDGASRLSPHAASAGTPLAPTPQRTCSRTQPAPVSETMGTKSSKRRKHSLTGGRKKPKSKAVVPSSPSPAPQTRAMTPTWDICELNFGNFELFEVAALTRFVSFIVVAHIEMAQCKKKGTKWCWVRSAGSRPIASISHAASSIS